MVMVNHPSPSPPQFCRMEVVEPNIDTKSFERKLSNYICKSSMSIYLAQISQLTSIPLVSMYLAQISTKHSVALIALINRSVHLLLHPVQHPVQHHSLVSLFFCKNLGSICKMSSNFTQKNLIITQVKRLYFRSLLWHCSRYTYYSTTMHLPNPSNYSLALTQTLTKP